MTNDIIANKLVKCVKIHKTVKYIVCNIYSTYRETTLKERIKKKASSTTHKKSVNVEEVDGEN